MKKVILKKQIVEIFWRMCSITAFSFYLLMPNFSLAQEALVSYPKPGDILDHQFTRLINTDRKSLSIQDRKGKWLVLDFWTRGCGMCFGSMPKMDKISKAFYTKADVLMVGFDYPSKLSSASKTYLDFVEKRSLKLASAIVDTTVSNKFDVGMVPSIFIIDPNGKLVAKVVHLDSTLLANFMSGKSPGYNRSYSRHEPISSSYNIKLPLLANGQYANGGLDTSATYRSVLTGWNDSMPEYPRGYGFNSFNPHQKGLAELIGYGLRLMYIIGYTGEFGWNKPPSSDTSSLYTKFSPSLILEIRDKKYFQTVDGTGLKNAQNTFAYSVKIPQEKFTYAKSRKMLIDDLDRYLGYKSSIEIRQCKVLKLIIADSAKVNSKLKTKGLRSARAEMQKNKELKYYLRPDSSIFFMDKLDIGRNYRNYPFKTFFGNYPFQSGDAINSNFNSTGKSSYENPRIIDGTGLDIRIDITFKNDHKDWLRVLETLSEYGLKFIESEMPMKCIVIRDAEPAKK